LSPRESARKYWWAPLIAVALIVLFRFTSSRPTTPTIPAPRFTDDLDEGPPPLPLRHAGRVPRAIDAGADAADAAISSSDTPR
jgi:hypothetical protein